MPEEWSHMLPLFVKYQTRTGNHYVYDVRSGEILCVSNAIYDILDDYHLLTPEELCPKYIAMGKEAVFDALSQLDEAQRQGLLADHSPEISSKVQSVCCGEEPQHIRDFLRHRRRLLTLDLTHQCNLACQYCIFGDHYQQTRQPSATPMSLDTAKRVIARFLSHKPKVATIGFYGGEPLLEFDLIKQIVPFAEQQAAQNGVDLRFNITTNGTLLSDEKIHYLVAHKSSVMISLDGNKESHDRYRVFKGTGWAEERRGSFDVIIRNMERFVQLYPDYMSRGIVLTLTATADLFEIEQFVTRWKPFFPAFVTTPVHPVTSPTEPSGSSHPIEMGVCYTSLCNEESCLQRQAHSKHVAELPEFDNWCTERLAAITLGLDNLVTNLCQSNDATTAQQLCNDSPICANLLRGQIEHIHYRSVVGTAARKLPVTRLSCFVGAARTYCSSQGAVFPCERVGFSELFEIGDATGDVDANKAYDFLIEMVRIACDCGNCISNQVCILCPALVTESLEFPGHPDFSALKKTCAQLASEELLAAKLTRYTEMMEANPRVLDWLYPKKGDGDQEDWLAHVKVLTAKQQDVELPVEELKEIE